MRFVSTGSGDARPLLALLALPALLALAACGGASPSGSSTQEVVIGSVNSVTGGGALSGIEDTNIIKLAVTDINKTSTKWHFTYSNVDDRSTPATSVASVEQVLATPNLVGIVGGNLSGDGAAEMPLVVQSGLPVVSSYQNIDSRGANVFSTLDPQSYFMSAIVNQVLVPKGIKTVGLIWQDQVALVQAANGIRTALTSAGITLVADQGAPYTTTDLSAQLTKVLAANPAAIAIVPSVAVAGSLVVQLRQRNYKGLIFGGESLSLPAFRAAAGDAVAGVLFSAEWDPSIANAGAQTVIQEYKTAYPGQPAPDAFGMSAYAATMMLYGAIEAAGSTDKAKVLAQLTTMKTSGVLGSNLTFDPTTGFLNIPGIVVQITSSGTMHYQG